MKPHSELMKPVTTAQYNVMRDHAAQLYVERDALRTKLAEAEAERDEAKELLVSLREAHYTAADNALTAKFGGEAVMHIVAQLVRWYRESGGPNYCGLGLSDPNTGERFEVTVQRVEGVSPQQLAADTRLALAASQAEVRELREAGIEVVKAQDNFDGPEDRRLGKAIQAIDELCSEPTSDTALRGLCERAVAAGRMQGMLDQQFVTGGYGRTEPGVSDATIVNEVLGPGAAPIAAEIKEKPMNEVMPPVAGVNIGFGDALKQLKQGRLVAREGWNGKGLAVGMQVPDEHSANTLPYLFIVYPQDHARYPGARCPWLASQTDILADDWFVLPV